jgi:adenylosuccinate lyase
MEARPVFRNLSPLDHRYYDANKELFSALAEHVSEEASVRYCVLVEAALLRGHMRRLGLDSEENLRAVAGLTDRVTPDEVYEAERETRHNIRALVRVMKRYLPDSLVPLVHLGATSVDILDTAAALRVRDAVVRVILPVAIEVEIELLRLARSYATTLQIGRTHGQHAVPITFGFAVSEYVARFGDCLGRIRDLAIDLRGKLSGAVGAYNSMSMIVADPQEFEREVLNELELRPGPHATQMVEPEYLLRLLLELNTAFGIVANLADDLRNLQRTEINEVREEFGSGQVGSSTMPQKRNPWNSEHVKSLWKAYAPRVVTFYMDQISEHQRDLTNSASGRFVAEYLAGFAAAVARMRSILRGLTVNRESMAENAARTGELALAEAAYSLLATEGLADAHEEVRQATLAAESEGTGLLDALKSRREVWDALSRALRGVSGLSAEEFFGDPAHYTGCAVQVAERVVTTYEAQMNDLREAITQ